MPLAEIRSLLVDYILAFDPVDTLRRIDVSCTTVVATRYPMARDFVKRIPEIQPCVVYLDKTHHVAYTDPHLVAELILGGATSTPSP
jgi:hypothetical protein